MVNFLRSAALAAVLAASGQQARAQGARAGCVFTGGSGGSIEETPGVLDLVQDISTFICDPFNGTADIAESDGVETAQAISNLIATAVVNLTADCFTSGFAGFEVNGLGLAEFTARDTFQTIIALTVDTQVCRNCTALASVTLEFIEDLVATAIAENELRLRAFSEPGGDEILLSDTQGFVPVVVQNTTTRIASALVNARSEANGTCTVDLVAAIENPGTGQILQCEVDVNAITESTEVQDLVITAAANTAAAICDGTQTTTGTVTAQELLSAQARAISEVVGACFNLGGPANAAGCTTGDARATDTALSIAQVFATGVAIGVSGTCGTACEDALDFNVSEIASVLASAASEAVGETCVIGEGFSIFEVFEQQTIALGTTILAQAFADATADAGVCNPADPSPTITIPPPAPIVVPADPPPINTVDGVPVGNPATATPDPVTPPPPAPVVTPPPPAPVVTPPPPAPVVTPPPPTPVTTPAPVAGGCAGGASTNRPCARVGTDGSLTNIVGCASAGDKCVLRTGGRFALCRLLTDTSSFAQGTTIECPV